MSVVIHLERSIIKRTITESSFGNRNKNSPSANELVQASPRGSRGVNKTLAASSSSVLRVLSSHPELLAKLLLHGEGAGLRPGPGGWRCSPAFSLWVLQPPPPCASCTRAWRATSRRSATRSGSTPSARARRWS